MASPFEIIALAETVVGIGSKICSFLKSVKGAAEEIRNLCTEIESLPGVLTDIGVSTSRLHDAAPVFMSGRGLGPETIFISLKGCESELNAIWMAVSPLYMERGLEWGHVSRKLSKSMSWALKSSDVERLIPAWRDKSRLLLLPCSCLECMSFLEHLTTRPLLMRRYHRKANKAIIEALVSIGDLI